MTSQDVPLHTPEAPHVSAASTPTITAEDLTVKYNPLGEGVKVTVAHELYHAMEGKKEHRCCSNRGR